MAYNKKAEKAQPKAESHDHDEEHLREKHLMLDPLPRGEMNDMVMEAMHEPPTWKFWVIFVILAVVVAYLLFYTWGVLIIEGLGVAGVNRPITGASSWSTPCSGSVSATRGRSSRPFCACSKRNSAAPSPAPPS